MDKRRKTMPRLDLWEYKAGRGRKGQEGGIAGLWVYGIGGRWGNGFWVWNIPALPVGFGVRRAGAMLDLGAWDSGGAFGWNLHGIWNMACMQRELTEVWR